MKKIFLILLIVFPLSLLAQTDRELLLELVKQHAETNKQIAELAKQQAITSTKVDGFEKVQTCSFAPSLILSRAELDICWCWIELSFQTPVKGIVSKLMAGGIKLASNWEAAFINSSRLNS